MLYSCIHMATQGVKGLSLQKLCNFHHSVFQDRTRRHVCIKWVSD